MFEVKRQGRRNRKIPLRLAAGCLGAIFVLVCGCRKKVHDAETALIPKVLVLTTNINDVAPEISLSVITEFKSLPSAWYCSHYGSGDGTKPWYYQDTARIDNPNGPIEISLRSKKKTYCPYVIKGAYIEFTEKGNPHHTRKMICIDRKGEPFGYSYPPLPLILNVDILRSEGTLLFKGRRIEGYQLPENSEVPLSVTINLKIEGKD